ncbi:hypothetical protein CR513_42534, partial [Mucuna pruriens]
MTLITHFDLELHQIDVKTMFLNDNIDETIYMMQLENFVLDHSKSMLLPHDFEANVVDDCICHKFSGILYIDDILLDSSDIGLLHKLRDF